eukprot:10360457-Ditylum_brightwellii.AAC.1
MEGASMEYYKKEEDDLIAFPDQVHKLISEFYSYLSDDSDQNAAKTTSHLDNMLVELVRRKIFSQKVSTIWEEMDGCTKQYRCATACYLLFYISMEFNIVIDHAVGAPGHGKDVVYGLNAVDKAYLNKMMFRINNPGSKHTAKDMMAHS